MLLKQAKYIPILLSSSKIMLCIKLCMFYCKKTGSKYLQSYFGAAV